MFLYKLKKVLKEELLETVSSSSVMALLGSCMPLFPFLFLHSDDFTKRDKKQMVATSFICVLVNFTSIYFSDYFFEYNIIISILMGIFFSFLIYLIPCFLIIITLQLSETVLDKDEIRDAKLNRLFRKLF